MATWTVESAGLFLPFWDSFSPSGWGTWDLQLGESFLLASLVISCFSVEKLPQCLICSLTRHIFIKFILWHRRACMWSNPMALTPPSLSSFPPSPLPPIFLQLTAPQLYLLVLFCNPEFNWRSRCDYGFEVIQFDISSANREKKIKV